MYPWKSLCTCFDSIIQQNLSTHFRLYNSSGWMREQIEGVCISIRLGRPPNVTLVQSLTTYTESCYFGFGLPLYFSHHHIKILRLSKFFKDVFMVNCHWLTIGRRSQMKAVWLWPNEFKLSYSWQHFEVCTWSLSDVVDVDSLTA